MNYQWLLEQGFQGAISPLFAAGYLAAWTLVNYLPGLSSTGFRTLAAARLVVAFLVLLAFLTPFLSPVSSSVAIGAALAIWALGEAARSRPGPLAQSAIAIAHVAVFAGGVAGLVTQAESSFYYDYWTDELANLARIGVVVSVYTINTALAGRLVAALLARYSPPAPPAADTPSNPRDRSRGRVIGILERMLVVTLVLGQQWAAMGLVVAAKSIARFRALEDRGFAEYYLVGTLASILIAALTGAAALLLI